MDTDDWLKLILVLILILLTSLIFYKIGLNQDKQKVIFDLTKV
jgi:hypothetical protein